MTKPVDVIADLAAQQEPLPRDMAKVLHDNLDALYESTDEPVDVEYIKSQHLYDDEVLAGNKGYKLTWQATWEGKVVHAHRGELLSAYDTQADIIADRTNDVIYLTAEIKRLRDALIEVSKHPAAMIYVGANVEAALKEQS